MKPRDVALALLVVVLWGSNFTVIKVGLAEIPPLTLGVIRFALVAIPGVFLVRPPALPVGKVIAFGWTMFTLQFALLFTGMHLGATAGIASVVLQVQVFFTLMLAALFLGEKPTAWQIAGAVVAFGGIGYVAHHVGGDISAAGLSFIVAAAAAWGAGNVLARKLGNVRMVALVVWSSAAALPPLLLLALMLEDPIHVIGTANRLSWMSYAAVAYIAYGSTLIPYSIWGRLLGRYRSGSVAPFTLLVPVVAMFVAALALHEPLQGWKFVAAALVVSGLCLNVFGQRLATWVQTIGARTIGRARRRKLNPSTRD